MKILLFSSGQSSLSHIFKQIFSQKLSDVEVINYLDFLPGSFHRLLDKSGRLPGIIEHRIRSFYFKQIQKKYAEIITRKKPDLIFVYNDQMLSADTIEKTTKSTKLGVYLADSPLFLQKRPHIIGLMRRADVVFAPDTYWLEQCKMLGASKTEYLIPGYNEQHHFKIDPNAEQFKRYASDVFFMGSPYKDTWGYKRALFLSKFCNYNFYFLGPKSWKYWFTYFPELEEHFVLKQGYLPDNELNVMMNCSKIIPVDANPGIINGFHVRVLDCIAAGVMPLVEYRKDLKDILKGSGLPLIKNYDEIPELAAYFINNDFERTTLVERLQHTVLQKYNIHTAADIIFSALTL